MEKTLNIEGKEVVFKATASTPRRYRQRFGKDLFVDVSKIMGEAERGGLTAEALESFENMAFIMARQGDSSIPDDPDEWLDGFEMMSIYDVMPQLIELWGMNAETLEEPKKK